MRNLISEQKNVIRDGTMKFICCVYFRDVFADTVTDIAQYHLNKNSQK